MDVLHYTAIRAERLAELDLPRLAAERELDLSYRPRIGAVESRVWVIGRADLGSYNKGTLAGWGIDQRDPTADRRLIEYCLSLPMSAFIAHGESRALARRALADRLPQAVIDERRKGYQAVDWHEGMRTGRADIAAELERLSPCAPAARTLDLERLQRLIEQCPDDGWGRHETVAAYRLALYRGVSAGHFLRKATGSNA
jgi:asparagine synthase (glutamine-hydrolysing)